MYYKKLLLLSFLLSIHLGLFFSCKKEKALTATEINWLQKNDSITIAVFPYYPPYQFLNNNDEIDGIFIDYLDLIEKKIDFKLNRKYYSHWPSVLKDIRNKKIDAIIEIQSTRKRSEYLNVYTRLFESEHVIVTQKNSSENFNIKDAEIILPKEYAISEIIRDKYPSIKITEEDDDISCLKKINASSSSLAYVGPKPIANYLIKTHNLDNLEIHSEIGITYKPGIGVHVDNKTLNSIIKKGIKNISNAESQDIIENWLYVENKPFYKKTSFILAILLSISILLFVVLGVNFYLGLIVNKKTKELRKAKNKAEKDEQLITTFIQNVSKEIQNPTDTIINFSKFLNDQKLTNSQKSRYTNIITTSCRQLIGQIDNVLEISQLQTKQIKLSLEKTDIYEVMDSIYTIFEIKAKQKGISLILNNNLNKDQRYIIIDKLKTIKVISAIIENAIKFTKKGAILISVALIEQKLIISIRDSGLGIDSKNQQIISNYLSSKSKKTVIKEHKGYGLIIAKENAKLMRGNLSFSSIKNQGSTFRLEIPFQPIAKTQPSPTDSVTQNRIQPYQVLIAEDGEINFLFLKTLLKKSNEYDFQVYRAKNGKDAVEFCANNKEIDLIFMDIKMPEMNGYEATRMIKKLTPKTPIIAQTAYSTKMDIKKTFDAGCDDFISKPIQSKKLKTILKKHLNDSGLN